jgi:hypothetical protein
VKKLKRSEKRLIVIFAALLALAGASYYMAPKEELTVEDIQAFYVNTFAGAKEIVVRPAQGSGAPVTLTGDDAARIGSQIDALVRYAAVSQTPAPVPAPWVVDVQMADGSWRKNIGVGLTLESPDQPERGKIWIVPRSPGDALNPGGEAAEETPAAIRVFDRVMHVERPSPVSKQPPSAPKAAPSGPAPP